MFKPIFSFLEKLAINRNIFLGLLFVFFINTVAFPFFSSMLYKTEIPITIILDTQFGFSVQYVNNLFTQLGVKGRNAYFYSTVFIDIPYAMAYGFIYSFIFIKVLKFKNRFSSFKYISLLAFFISMFDLIENIGIIYLIKIFPNYNSNYIEIISLANRLKWSFALLTLIMFFTILIVPKKQSKN